MKRAGFATIALMALIALALITVPVHASKVVTITKPVIISGTTYTTGNVTVDDATARMLVNDGKATYVSAPASQNLPDFYSNRITGVTITGTNINGTTYTGIGQAEVTGLTTASTPTFTGLNISGTATIATVAGTTYTGIDQAEVTGLTTASTPTFTGLNLSGLATVGNLTTAGTITAASVIVTGGTTTTCASGLASITIVSGIITAATCTP